jgi:hypothetical protein
MSVSITADRLEEYSDRARGAVVVITGAFGHLPVPPVCADRNVAGGATGLGKATALLFARHGYVPVYVRIEDVSLILG